MLETNKFLQSRKILRKGIRLGRKYPPHHLGFVPEMAPVSEERRF